MRAFTTGILSKVQYIVYRMYPYMSRPLLQQVPVALAPYEIYATETLASYDDLGSGAPHGLAVIDAECSNGGCTNTAEENGKCLHCIWANKY